MYSFRMSFCTVPRSWAGGTPCRCADGDVQRQQDGRRGVDGHRVVTLSSGMPSNSGSMSSSDRDRHAHLADFAQRHRVVGVVADLRGQIEGDRQAGLALVEQILVARVGLLGEAEAGVLAHRPQPAAVPVGWTPRVKGYSPGKPSRDSASLPAAEPEVDALERDAG